MAFRRKDDEIVLQIKAFRTEIKKKVEEYLLREYEEAQKAGKYPWEGLWLKPQEIQEVIKKIKLRDRIAFFEVILLFLLMLLFSCITYLVMDLLFLPR